MFPIIQALIPPVVILLPLVSGVFVYAFARGNPCLRNRVAAGATLLPLALTALLYSSASRGEVLKQSFDILPPLGLNLRVDALSFYVLLLFTFFGFCISLYAQNYMEGEKRQSLFFAVMLAVLGGCYGVALAGDIFTFFLFFEFMSLMFFVLVIHDRTEAAFRAGLKFLFMTIIAGVALFLGLVIIMRETGNLSFGSGGLISSESPLALLAFCGFLVALGIKAALFPLHLWVSDAYTRAPVPAAVISSTIMLKTGAYGLVRVFGDIYGFSFLESAGWSRPLVYLAAFSIIYGSTIALTQDDLIRRLAYSGIAQLGYVVLGISLLTGSSLTGALYHFLAHAFMKGALFLCAGAIIRGVGTRKISEMQGIGYRLPGVMLAFTVASLTAVGMPPFNIFISKWYLGMGALERGLPHIVIILLVSSFLNAAYYLPIAIRAFLGSRDRIPAWSGRGAGAREAAAASGEPAGNIPRPVTWKMTLPILLLTLGSFIFGLAGNWPLDLVKTGVAAFF